MALSKTSGSKIINFILGMAFLILLMFLVGQFFSGIAAAAKSAVVGIAKGGLTLVSNIATAVGSAVVGTAKFGWAATAAIVSAPLVVATGLWGIYKLVVKSFADKRANATNLYNHNVIVKKLDDAPRVDHTKNKEANIEVIVDPGTPSSEKRNTNVISHAEIMKGLLQGQDRGNSQKDQDKEYRELRESAETVFKSLQGVLQTTEEKPEVKIDKPPQKTKELDEEGQQEREHKINS